MSKYNNGDENMRYETIYIVRYNNGERNFKHERTTLDSYQVDDFFGEERDSANTRNLYYERLKELAPYAYEYIDKDAFCDITHIGYTVGEEDAFVKDLSIELLEHSKSVGGDDDTYDYFPDLVWAFEQICRRFKKTGVYNTVIAELNKRDNTIADEPWKTI